jgi:uncharacterized protein YbjT (DUF2867 family)
MIHLETSNFNAMKLTANIIGATGLTGSELVHLLLEDNRFTKVNIFVRRDTEIRHAKLEQHLVDFRNKRTWVKKLKGDVLFSALGTTRKQAGGKEKQYEVDFTYNLEFAREAQKNGIHTYVLVSSTGANPESRLFYPKIKGKLDSEVHKLGFRNLAILRPSSLTGKRNHRRLMEELSIPPLRLLTRFFFKKYRPIEGRTVAEAMICAAVNPNHDKTIWEADEVFDLANECIRSK